MQPAVVLATGGLMKEDEGVEIISNEELLSEKDTEEF